MQVPIPSVELPTKGPIRIYTPRIPAQREWFFDLIGWRSRLSVDPDGEGGLVMHRRHFPAVLNGLVERFGAVDLFRQYRPDEPCTSSCRRAKNADCSCSCAGEHHGAREGYSWLGGHIAGDYLAIGTGADDWSHTVVTTTDDVTRQFSP